MQLSMSCQLFIAQTLLQKKGGIPLVAPSCRAERRDKRRLTAELRPQPASGDIRAGFARCGLFRGRPTTFAIPRPDIADYRLAVFINMNMLDAHVLPPAVPQATQELHLNCESLQQAARRRS